MSMGKKVYYWFEELSPGRVKPGGTFGNHHMMVEQAEDGLCCTGSNGGEIVLYPGDKLGYCIGTIWKVPSPQNYKDPIRRILAFAHVGQSVLKYSDSPVVYWESYQKRIYPESCADHSTGDSAEIFGPHSDKIEYADIIGRYKHIIEGGHAVIIRTVVDFSTTRCRRRNVCRIVVRPNMADKVAVLEWLCKELYVDIDDILPSRRPHAPAQK